MRPQLQNTTVIGDVDDRNHCQEVPSICDRPRSMPVPSLVLLCIHHTPNNCGLLNSLSLFYYSTNAVHSDKS